MLADSFADSVALALMCDRISAAVRLLMPRVQGIMGCCTDGAEGWRKTVAIALFSLDAGLSVLIRPAAVRWGSILLRWPKVLTQTFQVSVMMPQTCHSCHTTDMTFFWLVRWKKKKKKNPNFTGWGKTSHILPPKFEDLPSFASACTVKLSKLLFYFSLRSRKAISSEFIGDLSDCNSGFNLRIKARPCH